MLPAEARRVRQPRRRAVHDLVRDRQPAPEPDRPRRGVSFAGFEGCVSYKRSGIGRVGPSYTQRQAKKLIRKLPRRGRPALPLPAARRQRRPRRSRAHRLRGAARVGARAPPAVSAARARPPAARLAAQPHRRHPGRLRQRREGAEPHIGAGNPTPARQAGSMLTRWTRGDLVGRCQRSRARTGAAALAARRGHRA